MQTRSLQSTLSLQSRSNSLLIETSGWFALVLTLLIFASPGNAQAGVVISEFMASNSSTLEDEDGDDEDWIELHNDGTLAVDLTGWYLTDDESELNQWRIPSLILEAGDYVVIFASSKDRNSTPLHTNFKLSSGGEYIALVAADGITVIDEIAPEYPQQFSDISYGASTGPGLYFNEPTPGAPNSAGYDGVVELDVTGERGFYTTAQTLTLASETPGASIRYTLDGNDPREPGSRVYTTPLTIDRTTVVRMVARRDGYIDSQVETHTLIFAADVAEQTTMSRSIVDDSTYGPLILDSLTSLPAISVVTRGVIDPDDDIETSLEWLTPDNSESFGLNAGVRNYGNSSLNSHPKNSMRLYFRGRYGASKLEFPLFEGHEKGIPATDTFDQLNLRTGSHDSPFWDGRGFNYEPRGSYLRTRWSDDTMLAMGHKTAHGRYVHVFLNGTYWGQYHLRERFNDDFLASYFGGDSKQYEMINEGIASDGDGSTWEIIKARSNNWQQVKEYIDDTQFVDYMILNLYAGNVWDWWASHNWRSGGFDGIADPGWQFFNSDQDIIFQDPANNLWDESYCQLRPSCTAGPDYLWENLRTEADPDLKMLFADRIYAHLFNDGVLTPAQVDATWMARHAQIEPSIVAETARWGNGQEWQQIPGGLKHTSFGIDGSIWGVNVLNHVYRRPNLVAGWQRIAGEYVQIDALDYNRAIAVNDSDQIFHYDGNAWVQLNGGLRRVSFGIDGSIWGVNINNQTYRRRSVEPTSAWQRMDVNYVDIDALDYERAVALDSSGNVDTFDGDTWSRLDGLFTDVSYAIDGSLWGIRTNGTVQRRKRLQLGWRTVPGTYAQVDGLYWDQAISVQSDDTIHHYSGTAYDYQRDDEWDTEIDRLRQQYFPFRTATVVQQFRDQGWYPDLEPASLSESADGALTLTNPNASGAVLYTIDGSDPRLPGGAVSTSAVQCAAPCTLNFATPTDVRVRVKDGAVWSAIANGVATGTISVISVTDTTVNESDGEVNIGITITPPSNVPLGVGIHTRSVTAQGGSDFYGFTRTLDIDSGVGQVSVSLSILDDNITESTETLQIKLFNVEGATTGVDTATVTITDDDAGPAPTLSVTDLTVSESVGTATVAISLSAPAIAPVTVSVHTRSESATGGADYYGFTRSVSFAIGEQSKSVALSVLNDSLVEGTETIGIRLFNAVGADIAQARAQVSIEDDDAVTPTVNISNASVSESVGSAMVTVSLSQSSTTDSSVQIYTRPLSAQSGVDFYGFTKTLNFAAGETSQNVSVTIINDNDAETPTTETLLLRLFNPGGLEIGNGEATLTIEDDD